MGFFFFLPVENGGAFYDPCSLSSCKNHTSSFPGLQHQQPMKTTECVEKKQSKHGRKREKLRLGREYLQLDLRCIHHQKESLLAPAGERRLCRGNRHWRSPRARWRLFVCSRRVFWVRPNRDAAMHGPTAHGWLTGRRVVLRFLNADPIFHHILSGTNKNK